MMGLLKRIFGGGERAAPAPAESISGGAGEHVRYLIVGAGPAGVSVAEHLRHQDAEGRILLLGGEVHPPYSRMAIPYLLTGKVSESGTYLRQEDNYYEQQGIECQQGRVSRIDREARHVILDDGARIGYEQLCLATGARPIKPPIPGLDQPAVHHCWTLDDARRIIELAHPGADVVLMGAGFIGCIILEALALRGVNLTVVEMGDRMVPRMLDPVAGTLLKQWCQEKGIAVHTSTRITKLEPNAGDAEDTLLVDLDNGQQLPAHLVVVAAGVKSNLDYLDGAGLAVDQGVLVDECLCTSDPNIYAIGDVAQGPDFENGDRVVHAIQPTAADHGRIAALNMTGQHVPYRGSLQMNVLDTLGLISVSFGEWDGVPGGDQAVLTDKSGYRYMRLEFNGDRLVGAQCVGRTDHVGVLRGLIKGRVPLGDWKAKLKRDPHRVMEAYLACAQR